MHVFEVLLKWLVERSGWIGNVVSFVSVFLKVIFDLLFSSD